MKIKILLLIVLILVLIGCGQKILETSPLEKQITESIEKEQAVEQIVEKVVQKEEKIPEAPTEEIKEVPVAQEKQELEEVKKVVAPSAETTIPTETKVETVKTYLGKITEIIPPTKGIYSGEITALELGMRHYKFISSIPVIRGDTVTFTFDVNDLAIVVKKEGEIQAPKTTMTENVQIPGAVLGRIKSVISTVDGGFRGQVVNAASGTSYRYETPILLSVNDYVYFMPGEDPVQIVKKVEKRTAK